MPSEPLGSALRSIVRGLAESHGAVEFEPHVTVFCGPSTEATARAVAQRIAKRFAPVALASIGLDQTESYTKTLFVQFQESALVRRMSAAARVYSPTSNYTLNPHLSLLYETLPEAGRRELCETLEYPSGDYGFDRIRLIETELPIEDPGPIRRWRTIFDGPLAGA